MRPRMVNPALANSATFSGSICIRHNGSMSVGKKTNNLAKTRTCSDEERIIVNVYNLMFNNFV